MDRSDEKSLARSDRIITVKNTGGLRITVKTNGRFFCLSYLRKQVSSNLKRVLDSRLRGNDNYKMDIKIFSAVLTDDDSAGIIAAQ